MRGRQAWVSPELFRELNKARQQVSQYDESLPAEMALRLRLWPDTGFSLAERIILAEIAWGDAPFPPGGGGKGKLQARLDHWLALADELYGLPDGLDNVLALGNTKIIVDRDGSFEPYTLRLPSEARLRNPTTRMYGA